MAADGRGADERRLSVGALRALAAVAVPVIPGAAVLAGAPGVRGALAGLALVGLLFAGGAELTRLVADRRPQTIALVLVMGVVGRLLAYAAALAWVANLGGVHRTATALSIVVALVVVLGHEIQLLSRLPRLFWVDADADRSPAVPNAIRSRSS